MTTTQIRGQKVKVGDVITIDDTTITVEQIGQRSSWGLWFQGRDEEWNNHHLNVQDRADFVTITR